MMRRMHYVAPLFAIAVAACGGELNDSAVPDTVGGEVATTSDAGMVVAATLTEWQINVPDDTLSPGNYTFRVQNSGQYTHALEIEGQGEEWETDPLTPDQNAELTVTLEPGIYELYCPVDDTHGKHRELGMTRRIVVRE